MPQLLLKTPRPAPKALHAVVPEGMDRAERATTCSQLCLLPGALLEPGFPEKRGTFLLDLERSYKDARKGEPETLFFATLEAKATPLFY